MWSPPGWLLVVSATLAADADVAAFHDWYDHVHLPAIAACPGFQEGVRYVGIEHDSAAERNFLALYRIDGPEVLESEEFAARRGFGPFSHQVTFTTRLYARHVPLARKRSR